MTEKLNSSNLRQNPRNVNELVNELTLFDDDLMSRVVLCQDLVQVKMRNFSPF